MTSSTQTDPSSASTESTTESTRPTVGSSVESGTSRRQAIVGAGSLCLLGLGLAACSSDSDSTTDAGTATSASAGSGGSEGSTTGGAKIVALADIEEGGAVSATINGKNAVIARPKKDVVVAFDATCPHQGGKVAPDGDIFKCPLHGSTFNETTGEVLSGPATSGLKEIEVVIDGDNVVAG